MKTYIKLKITLILIVLSAIFNSKIYAQTHYAIPDIGSPGMNIYVEVIAEYNQKNKFGADGFYGNLQTSANRVFVPPAFEPYVAISPFVVSWEGRVIGMQIFISEDIDPAPQSWDYRTSGVSFPVTVQIGVQTYQFTFYVVQPLQFGNQSANMQTTLGEGGFGVRSPSGAMIVDSMVLRNGITYQTNTGIDINPNINGNQGYLPLIILSKGPVYTEGSNKATISVNGTGKNGGPGGGGGAGQFCDVILGASGQGTDGGGGFTGGGPGGQNGTAGSSNQRRTPGEGTGSVPGGGTQFGGASINGVPGGNSTNAFEASGGGTGHPFGVSGDGCGDGANCNPVGQYGAGSGQKQRHRGGGGGFGTAGQSHDGTTDNGGKAHGNLMGVPIAGGSGGGSGNPQGISACAGDGGGGGGAIRLFAREFKNIKVTALGGAAGVGTQDAFGGGGSGGFIEISSKLSNIQDLETEVFGGVSNATRTGGAGRVRIDGYPTYSGTIQPIDATVYLGPSTDTTHWVQREFELSGTQTPGTILTLYLREAGAGKEWITLGQTNPNASGFWTYPINLTAFAATDFYLTAIQTVNNPSTGEYTREPSFVFSQAAANHFKIELAPDIDADTVINMSLVLCKDSDFDEVSDTLVIKNTGDAGLRLFADETNWALDVGIEHSLQFSRFLQNNGDETNIIFTYKRKSGEVGLISDTLFIGNNTRDKNPWKVVVNINIDTIGYRFLDENRNIINSDTLTMGTLCVNQVLEKDFFYDNTSSMGVTIESITLLNNSDFTLLNFIPNTFVQANRLLQLRFRFEDDMPNQIFRVSTKAIIKLAECTEPDTIVIMVDVREAKLVLTNPLNAEFGDTRIGDTKTRDLIFTNSGRASTLISTPPVVAAPFIFVGSNPVLPHTLGANESITFTFSYTPTETDQNDNAEVTILGDDCASEIIFDISGNGVAPSLIYPTDPINFGTWLDCQNMVGDSLIIIRNESANIDIILEPAASIVGPDAASFELVQAPATPFTLTPISSQFYRVKYLPNIGGAGVKQATLEIYTNDPDYPSVGIRLIGTTEGLNIETTPVAQSLDFEKVPINSNSQVKQVTLVNRGTITREVTSITLPNNVDVNPLNAVLQPNTPVVFNFTVTPDVEGIVNFQMIFNIDETECSEQITFDGIVDGQKANVNVIADGNFGILNPCQGDNSEVEIRNDGEIDVIIARVFLDGVNVNLFELRTPPPLPDNVTLAPNERAYVTVEFNSNGDRLTTGIKTVDVVVVVIENGVPVEYRRRMQVEIKPGVITLPQIVDFGNVTVGTTSTLSVTISADNSWDITIEETEPIANFPANFLFNKAEIDNQVLTNPITFDITFQPTVFNQMYIDTLYLPFVITNFPPCPDTVFIVLRGYGRQAATVLLSTENQLEVDPRRRDVEIPISARVIAGDPVQDFVFENISLSFDRTIFYPQEFLNATLTSQDELDNNIVQMNLELLPVDIGLTNSVVATVRGSALLGTNDQSQIVLSNAQYSMIEKVSDVEYENSIMTLEICEENGRRLLQYSENPFTITAFFENNYTYKIEVTTLERGVHKMELVSMDGSSEILKEWRAKELSTDIIEYTINSEKYNSGVYLIRVVSPSDVKTAKIVIVK